MKLNKFLYIPTILSVISVVLYSLQSWLLANFFDSFTFYYAIWKIYIFHFLVTFVILCALFVVSKKTPEYIGFAFLGFILLKMVAAIVFLIPLIKLENASKIPDFISFFIPYFIYLLLEILLTLKLLRQATN